MSAAGDTCKDTNSVPAADRYPVSYATYKQLYCCYGDTLANMMTGECFLHARSSHQRSSVSAHNVKNPDRVAKLMLHASSLTNNCVISSISHNQSNISQLMLQQMNKTVHFNVRKRFMLMKRKVSIFDDNEIVDQDVLLDAGDVSAHRLCSDSSVIAATNDMTSRNASIVKLSLTSGQSKASKMKQLFCPSVLVLI